MAIWEKIVTGSFPNGQTWQIQKTSDDSEMKLRPKRCECESDNCNHSLPWMNITAGNPGFERFIQLAYSQTKRYQ
jgi:hypothetical protein